jgi:MOSC domain-containing protein YiiM
MSHTPGSPTILQLNVSRGGIPKRPVPEAYVSPSGLAGDSWAHPQYHGGPKQAVLLITSEGLEELRALGYSASPGALGENFTTAGIDRRAVRIGQRYRAGQALIEITKLRVPCATLDMFNGPGLPPIQDVLFDALVKAGEVSSPRWGLGGFYARVVEDGLVRSGDPVALVDALA